MRQFLANKPLKARKNIDGLRDLLGLDETELSVELAAQLATDRILDAGKKRRDQELKNTLMLDRQA